MKALTASVFILHAVAMLCYRSRWRSLGVFALAIASITSSLMLGGLILALFQMENLSAGHPTIGLFPSLMTLFAFFLAGVQEGEILYRRGNRGAAWVIVLIGCIGLLGYAVNQPGLYYFIPHLSTAMALNTCICFVLLGLSLILIENAPAITLTDTR